MSLQIQNSVDYIFSATTLSISNPFRSFIHRLENQLVPFCLLMNEQTWFCRDKNQLAQIKIAEKLADWKFKLIGFANENSTYLAKCESYVNKMGIRNVEFEVNVPVAKKYELLRQSKFFIHPNINEPFGISTAESILSGCLPLVHNSGGQKEIVPFADLRFNIIDEISGMLEKFSECDNHLVQIQKQLIHHCREHFDLQVFKEKMDAQINHFVSLKLGLQYHQG